MISICIGDKAFLSSAGLEDADDHLGGICCESSLSATARRLDTNLDYSQSRADSIRHAQIAA
jgi:hypothetical protein